MWFLKQSPLPAPPPLIKVLTQKSPACRLRGSCRIAWGLPTCARLRACAKPPAGAATRNRDSKPETRKAGTPVLQRHLAHSVLQG